MKRPIGEEFACKALELDPDLAEGHALMSSIAGVRGQMKQAFRHAQRTLKINPSEVDALCWLLFSAFLLGKTPLTTRFADHLAKIDPLSYVAPMVRSLDPWAHGRYDVVLDACRAAYRLDPESFLARWWLVQGLAANRLFDEAETINDSMLKEAPGHFMPRAIPFILHGLRGDHTQALKTVSEEWTDLAWKDYYLPYTVAEGYALLGETAEALRWLEHAVGHDGMTECHQKNRKQSYDLGSSEFGTNRISHCSRSWLRATPSYSWHNDGHPARCVRGDPSRPQSATGRSRRPRIGRQISRKLNEPAGRGNGQTVTRRAIYQELTAQRERKNQWMSQLHALPNSKFPGESGT